MGKVKEIEYSANVLLKEKYLDELLKYQEAYHILMRYFDIALTDEEKNEIHLELERLGL